MYKPGFEDNWAESLVIKICYKLGHNANNVLINIVSSLLNSPKGFASQSILMINPRTPRGVNFHVRHHHFSRYLSEICFNCTFLTCASTNSMRYVKISICATWQFMKVGHRRPPSSGDKLTSPTGFCLSQAQMRYLRHTCSVFRLVPHDHYNIS